MSQSFNQPNDYAQTVMTFAQSMVAEYTEKAANAAEGSADKRAYMDYADHFAKQVEEYEERERIFARAAAAEAARWDDSCCQLGCDCGM